MSRETHSFIDRQTSDATGQQLLWSRATRATRIPIRKTAYLEDLLRHVETGNVVPFDLWRPIKHVVEDRVCVLCVVLDESTAACSR